MSFRLPGRRADARVCYLLCCHTLTLTHPLLASDPPSMGRIPMGPSSVDEDGDGLIDEKEFVHFVTRILGLSLPKPELGAPPMPHIQRTSSLCLAPYYASRSVLAESSEGRTDE